MENGENAGESNRIPNICHSISMSIDQGELCVIRLSVALGATCQRLKYFQMLVLANEDGFRTVEEMKNWFLKTHSNLDGETFQVIKWRKLPLEG